MNDKSCILVIIIIIFIYLVDACNSEKKKLKKDSFFNDSVINNSVNASNHNNISEVSKNYKYYCDSDNNINFKVYLEYDYGNNNIDSFMLVLTGKLDQQKEQWDSSFTVKDIQFYRSIKNRLEKIKIQSSTDSFPSHFYLSDLEVFNYKNKDLSDFTLNRINLIDYNFDNYPDLSIYCRGNSGTGGEIYYTWIYDSKKEYYKFDTILSSADIGSIDSKNKTITLWWKYGWCDHNVWLYKVQKDNYKLIEETSYYSVTDSTGNVDCVEKIKKY